MKDWPKVILALDLPEEEVGGLLDEVGDLLSCCKVGLKHVASGRHVEVVEALKAKGLRLFLDGKFHDIPNTVAGASRSAVALGAWIFTVHASGGRQMMRAAREAAEEQGAAMGLPFRPLPVAVTVLTSMDQELWSGLFDTRRKVEDQVLRFVEEAVAAGLEAVVASPLEVEAIRKRFGGEIAIITPGIRPAWAARGDQKRIAEPGKTVAAGATSLVIGRPILSPPPEVGGRRNAIERIASEIGGF